MKIHYDDSRKSITIENSFPHKYVGMRLILIINLINAGIRLFDLELSSVDLMDYLWIILGVSSIIGLIYHYLKKTTSNVIQIDSIDCFIEKSPLIIKQYYLLLNNGKTRDLTGLRKQTEIAEIKKLFNQIGIKMLEK